MYKDEIIEEVWKNRDEYVKSHHYSLDEILKDLKRRQNLSISVKQGTIKHLRLNIDKKEPVVVQFGLYDLNWI